MAANSELFFKENTIFREQLILEGVNLKKI